VAGLQLIIAGDQYNTISKPSEIVGGAAAEVTAKLLKGDKPTSSDVLFGSPTKLYDPTLVTSQNLKAEIIGKSINTPAELCTKEYAAACAKLGIS
jgi:D-xylose transport system substrate-binding protein